MRDCLVQASVGARANARVEYGAPARVPEEVEEAGFGDGYREGLERSRAEWERLRSEGLAEEAPYAAALAYGSATCST